MGSGLRRHREYRGSARQRGYDSRWDKARRSYLVSHPLCVMCKSDGSLVPATVVDHRVPHRGDQSLFWDVNNWQALCRRHHDSVKQSEEYRGYSLECGADGWPIDPQHPANRAG